VNVGVNEARPPGRNCRERQRTGAARLGREGRRFIDVAGFEQAEGADRDLRFVRERSGWCADRRVVARAFGAAEHFRYAQQFAFFGGDFPSFRTSGKRAASTRVGGCKCLTGGESE
jgi:hypothetical protein